MYSFEGLDPFEARRAKLDALRGAGIDPFPAKTPDHVQVVFARAEGEGLQGEEHGATVAIAGRVLAWRAQGGLIFADLQDATGKIQSVCKRDQLAERVFDQLALVDLGDFLWVRGELFVSRRGELTIDVAEWQMLTKTLRPLPDAWHGLVDEEQRQRQRYLDLIANPEVKERFMQRSKLITTMRAALADEGFIEIETPVLESTPGGADAEPFVTHHNALDTDFFLRISLELHLKRAVVGGFDRVFEIGKVFRNEGLSPQHLQEFTEMEFYWAYADYNQLMQLVQRLYQRIIQETFGSLTIERGEHVLNFGGEWPRTTYQDLMKQYAGVDVLAVSDEELLEHVRAHRPDVSADLGRGRLLDLLYKKTARPHLIQPQFITDVPVAFSPLAKRKAGQPDVAERILVLIDGAEVGNGFSELNDPDDQRSRFEEQEALRAAGDDEAMRLDEDFLTALAHGLPPTAGFGVGIDRLMAILADVPTIRDVVLFPPMRRE